MKIAVVHDWLNSMRGGELLLEEILNIFPTAHIYSLFYYPENISEKINLFPIHTSFFQNFPKFVKKQYRYFLLTFPSIIKSFDLKSYDFIFSVSHCVAKGIKKYKHQKHICYCNSPMRYLYDQFDVYFKKSSGGLKFSGQILNLFKRSLKKWDYDTSQNENVDLFIANSNNIAKKINKYWQRDSDVIYPFVNNDFYTPNENYVRDKNSDYFLVVSALVPYKRIDIAIRAFNIIDKKLIIVGEGSEYKNLSKIAKDNIKFLGRVCDEELKELYKNCTALVFPGEEDFGIVPLEAMSCGRPVIAYRKGGALETIIENETGVFFKEPTEESLINCVKDFKEENFDPGICRKQAENFSREIFRKRIKRFMKDNYSLAL